MRIHTRFHRSLQKFSFTENRLVFMESDKVNSEGSEKEANKTVDIQKRAIEYKEKLENAKVILSGQKTIKSKINTVIDGSAEEGSTEGIMILTQRFIKRLEEISSIIDIESDEKQLTLRVKNKAIDADNLDSIIDILKNANDKDITIDLTQIIIISSKQIEELGKAIVNREGSDYLFIIKLKSGRVYNQIKDSLSNNNELIFKNLTLVNIDEDEAKTNTPHESIEQDDSKEDNEEDVEKKAEEDQDKKIDDIEANLENSKQKISTQYNEYLYCNETKNQFEVYIKKTELNKDDVSFFGEVMKKMNHKNIQINATKCEIIDKEIIEYISKKASKLKEENKHILLLVNEDVKNNISLNNDSLLRVKTSEEHLLDDLDYNDESSVGEEEDSQKQTQGTSIDKNDISSRDSDTYPLEDGDSYTFEDSDTYPLEDGDSYTFEDSDTYPLEDGDSYTFEDSDTYPLEDGDSYTFEDSDTYPLEDGDSYTFEDSDTYPLEDGDSYEIDDFEDDKKVNKFLEYYDVVFLDIYVNKGELNEEDVQIFREVIENYKNIDDDIYIDVSNCTKIDLEIFRYLSHKAKDLQEANLDIILYTKTETQKLELEGELINNSLDEYNLKVRDSSAQLEDDEDIDEMTFLEDSLPDNYSANEHIENYDYNDIDEYENQKEIIDSLMDSLYDKSIGFLDYHEEENEIYIRTLKQQLTNDDLSPFIKLLKDIRNKIIYIDISKSIDIAPSILRFIINKANDLKNTYKNISIFVNNASTKKHIEDAIEKLDGGEINNIYIISYKKMLGKEQESNNRLTTDGFFTDNNDNEESIDTDEDQEETLESMENYNWDTFEEHVPSIEVSPDDDINNANRRLINHDWRNSIEMPEGILIAPETEEQILSFTEVDPTAPEFDKYDESNIIKKAWGKYLQSELSEEQQKKKGEHEGTLNNAISNNTFGVAQGEHTLIEAAKELEEKYTESIQEKIEAFIHADIHIETNSSEDPDGDNNTDTENNEISENKKIIHEFLAENRTLTPQTAKLLTERLEAEIKSKKDTITKLTIELAKKNAQTSNDTLKQLQKTVEVYSKMLPKLLEINEQNTFLNEKLSPAISELSDIYEEEKALPKALQESIDKKEDLLMQLQGLELKVDRDNVIAELQKTDYEFTQVLAKSIKKEYPAVDPEYLFRILKKELQDRKKEIAELVEISKTKTGDEKTEAQKKLIGIYKRNIGLFTKKRDLNEVTNIIYKNDANELDLKESTGKIAARLHAHEKYKWKNTQEGGVLNGISNIYDDYWRSDLKQQIKTTTGIVAGAAGVVYVAPLAIKTWLAAKAFQYVVYYPTTKFIIPKSAQFIKKRLENFSNNAWDIAKNENSDVVSKLFFATATGVAKLGAMGSEQIDKFSQGAHEAIFSDDPKKKWNIYKPLDFVLRKLPYKVQSKYNANLKLDDKDEINTLWRAMMSSTVISAKISKKLFERLIQEEGSRVAINAAIAGSKKYYPSGTGGSAKKDDAA